MQDNSISSDTEPDSSGETKIYANLDSLSVGGIPPAVGDSVDLTVKGTVSSVEGSVACISPDEINGQPAPSAPGNKNESLDQQGARLGAKAQADDQASAY